MSSSVNRPGRQRSEESRQAILRAAREILLDEGLRGVSIDKIAQRSGTGKQTIYRWWPSKADVLMEALAERADLDIEIVDRGSLTAELNGFLRQSFRLAREPDTSQLLRALLAEAQVNPDFGDRFRASFLARRRRALLTILDRARDRGELPGRVANDTLADVLFGTLWYRVMVMPSLPDDALADQLVTLITCHPQHAS